MCCVSCGFGPMGKGLGSIITDLRLWVLHLLLSPLSSWSLLNFMCLHRRAFPKCDWVAVAWNVPFQTGFTPKCERFPLLTSIHTTTDPPETSARHPAVHSLLTLSEGGLRAWEVKASQRHLPTPSNKLSPTL